MERLALTEALREWCAVVGTPHVIQDPEVLRGASTATFATAPQVQAIVRPGDRNAVQQCVRIANQFGVPVYPISTGKNWGYGSRVPSQDGVLLDLGRLDRIVDFDEELAYVTVEPGVTQRQLHDFLRSRHSRLWMDATGASPDCSLIGNTLERGFGHTPMGDHCGNACGFEVVLPTGDCLETGYGRFSGARTGPLNRWGVGPSLDGLFSQSNFGIVTRMSIWLMPAPECFQAFFFACRDANGLGAIVDALRPLRMNGTLRSVMHIGNDYKVLAATGRFPWGDPDARAPLDRDAMETLRRTRSIASWSGSGGLYGTRAQVREARKQLRRALAGKVDRLQFVDDRLLRFMERFSTPFRLLSGWDVSRTIKVIAPVYNLLKGIPSEASLASAYWRKKTDPPAQMDPDRDGCGLLWCCPVVPNRGAELTEVTGLASSVLLAHGFEPQMSISLTTERSAICVISLSYDRATAGEDERATACYQTLTAQLLALGYPPYRLNVGSMHFLDGHGAYSGVLSDLKAALDPNGVLAPGRYEPASSSIPASGRGHLSAVR
jgi:4-cresol dehydrogenase (hydroxylating) flavoprotein subunit